MRWPPLIVYLLFHNDCAIGEDVAADGGDDCGGDCEGHDDAGANEDYCLNYLKLNY